MDSFLITKKYYFTILAITIAIVPVVARAQGIPVELSGITVTDFVVPVVTSTTTTATATSATAAATQQLAQKKTAQDIAEGLAYTFVRQLSKKLIAMAFAELQGGASGFDHPERFIRDFAELGNNLVIQETGVFTKALLASEKDNPVAAAIGVSMINSGVKTGLSALNSTINKIPGVDYTYASQDISTAGIRGWDFYSQLAIPQNTPIGTAQSAQQILASNIQHAQQIKQKELSSSGYAPARSGCDINFNPNQGFDLSDLEAQVQASQAGYDAAVADGGGVPTQAQLAIIADNKKDLDQAKAALEKVKAAKKANTSEYALGCSNAIITNPKGAIDDIARQAISKPFEDLEKESKWYTILNEAIQQVATGLINYGISKVPANNVFNFD